STHLEASSHATSTRDSRNQRSLGSASIISVVDLERVAWISNETHLLTTPTKATYLNKDVDMASS
ncbi:hypothetical protein, partial [Ferrimicrobium acidiphilum]|uniref:hypothetical protein n=1 Tax=Ferrimicrobium acidiphilum TaxID=121039 RepID=UPI0023F0D4D3